MGRYCFWFLHLPTQTDAKTILPLTIYNNSEKLEGEARHPDNYLIRNRMKVSQSGVPELFWHKMCFQGGIGQVEHKCDDILPQQHGGR